MPLDEDIARIAALRGRSAAPLIERAHTPPLLQRASVERILHFEAGHDATQDQRWFDALPAKSRAFMRDSDTPLNATWWAWNLHECGNQEDELIKAVQYLLNATGRP